MNSQNVLNNLSATYCQTVGLLLSYLKKLPKVPKHIPNRRKFVKSGHPVEG
jgi:hypothetical protein